LPLSLEFEAGSDREISSSSREDRLYRDMRSGFVDTATPDSEGPA